jgi:cation diffusion facilitator CzcD-associated flavoprotein CzcO
MTPQPEPHGLDGLEARLRDDLACLNYPPANWVPPTRHPSGPVSDVVVIGGGMCGLAAGFALRRHGIGNLRILDRSPAGREGPWATTARMETLRSPKELTGPALGIGALTFRAWYVAQHGGGAWAALGKIPRLQWMDYLAWYRRVLDLPVENRVEVRRIVPLDGLLRLELAGATPEIALTRKIVLATGRAGLGAAATPAFVDGLPRARWAHSADDIDFAALAGRRVVVVGAGASAMDNAALALEHGAASVRLLIRRPLMPRVNKLMGIGSVGFAAGFPQLSDAWRWRFMHHAGAAQTPAPRESALRVSRHANASFHLGSGIAAVHPADGALQISTTRGKVFAADFLILATGFTVDPAARPEIAAFADRIALWRDRYTPPAALADDELAGFPYLGPKFEFLEKRPGDAPWLADLHCFNHAASLSLGKVSGDIPKISDGAVWLAQAIAADLYGHDIERHWQTLVSYDKPELLGDEWTDAEG